jgi:hypothetical protein
MPSSLSRLDHLQKAQEHLGQAIERLSRAADQIEDIEADLAGNLRLVIAVARKAEGLLLDCEEASPVGDPDPYLSALEAL